MDERSLGVELSGDRFFALSAVLLFRAGVDVRAAWIAQTVRRNDAEHAVLAGFASETHHDAGALAGDAHLGFRLVVAAPFYLDVGLRVMALGTWTSTGVDVRALGVGTLGVGPSLSRVVASWACCSLSTALPLPWRSCSRPARGETTAS